MLDIGFFRWRRMRRAVLESFNPRAVEQYRFIQLEAIVLGMLRTIVNPDAWEKNLQVYDSVPYT